MNQPRMVWCYWRYGVVLLALWCGVIGVCDDEENLMRLNTSYHL
jgi:hypothetical protein